MEEGKGADDTKKSQVDESFGEGASSFLSLAGTEAKGGCDTKNGSSTQEREMGYTTRSVEASLADLNLRHQPRDPATMAHSQLTRGYTASFSERSMFSGQSPICTGRSRMYSSPVFRSVSIHREVASAGFAPSPSQLDQSRLAESARIGLQKHAPTAASAKNNLLSTSVTASKSASASVSASASASVSTCVEVEPPLPPGGYLEKSTTFRTLVTPEKTMKNIRDILTELEVDFTEKRDKFKFKCEVYPRGVRLPFNVRIFKYSGSYAVEVQRRAGDCLSFARVYDSFIQKCSSRGLCERTRESSEPTPLSCPTYPTYADDFGEAYFPEVEESQIEDAIKPLLQMAQSEFVDVQASAISAMSELSRGKAVVNWVAGNLQTCCKLLEALLSADVQDIHRPAATTVANLASTKDICDHLNKTSCVSTLLKLLISSNAHVVRESSRALKNISNFVGKNMNASPAALEVMLQSKDARVQSNAEAIRRNIGVQI